VTTVKGKTTNDADGVLVRYNPDGSLDSTLGGDGIQTTSLGSSADSFWDLAVQADQKIVAAGLVVGNNGQMLVARYLPDGSLDPSFDGDGKAFTSFPGGGRRDTHVAAQAYALELQPDQKLVVAGRVWNYTTGKWRFGLARFNSNGSLDTTFGGTGQLTTDFGVGGSYEVSDLALQSDGKVIAAGGGGGHFLLARYNANGTLDSSFDGDGKVVLDASSADGGGVFGGLVIQPDGKIVAVGLQYPSQGIVTRFNQDGSLDSSFGNGGLVKYPEIPSALREVELQSDGKIVVSGVYDLRATRLNSDGSIDTSFGGTGTVLISDVINGQDLLVQANDPSTPDDDKIVMIGYGDGGNNFVVARLNSDGTTDTTWGGGADAASSSTVAIADTTVAPPPAGTGNSISALDAMSIQQLLAEPNSENTWTRKSRFKLLAL
jgi:uncharacterized delta-60 repeat protein